MSTVDEGEHTTTVVVEKLYADSIASSISVPPIVPQIATRLAMGVACPACHAPIGKPCMGRKVRRALHIERWWAWNLVSSINPDLRPSTLPVELRVSEKQWSKRHRSNDRRRSHREAREAKGWQGWE